MCGKSPDIFPTFLIPEWVLLCWKAADDICIGAAMLSIDPPASGTVISYIIIDKKWIVDAQLKQIVTSMTS